MNNQNGPKVKAVCISRIRALAVSSIYTREIKFVYSENFFALSLSLSLCIANAPKL